MPPVTQKMIVAVAVVLALMGGLGALIYAKTNDIAQLQGEVDQIKAEITELEAFVATRAQKEKSRAQQDEVFRELVSILPQYSERQEERVLEALTQYQSVSKLKYRGHGFVVKKGVAPPGAPPAPPGPPAPGQVATDFTESEVIARYEGTFNNFLKFLDMVEKHESFLRVNAFQIAPQLVPAGTPQPEQRECTITVRISTFHYAPGK